MRGMICVESKIKFSLLIKFNPTDRFILDDEEKEKQVWRAMHFKK